MASLADVVGAGRAWLDTTWRHQGRGWAGLDCAGLVIAVAWTLNLPALDVTGYRRWPNLPQFLAAFRSQMDEIFPLRAAVAGDVALFLRPDDLCHAGILSERLGVRHVIHAWEPAGKVVEAPLESAGVGKMVAAFRYRGLTALLRSQESFAG